LTRDIGPRGSEDLACKRGTREVARADPPIIKAGRIRESGRLWVKTPEGAGRALTLRAVRKEKVLVGAAVRGGQLLSALWWDELQADRRSKGKQKIKSWDRMIAKMKAKFIPRDYQITLFRRMQNLRQKLMTVKEYTEEFYRLNIRAGHRESDDEKVARYLNGLRYDIQDELSILTIRTVEDAYQMALKAEEKLSRKQGQRGRGRSQPEARLLPRKNSKAQGGLEEPQGKAERGGTSQQRQQIAEPRRQQDDQQGDYADANTFPHTRGRGRG
jgi:hypothetical protein